MATLTDFPGTRLPTAPGSENAITPRRAPRGFVELLARSNFSFLQGASHPDEMVEEAIRNGYSGIALCDLGGLYGVARGFTTMQRPSAFVASVRPEEHFKYLVAAELQLMDESTVALLPRTKAGYANLCKLLTIGKRNVPKYFSRITLEDIAEHHEDLFAFALPPWNRERLERLQGIFGNQLYLPVWRDLTWESLQFGREAFRLESEGFQLVATQRPFMHRRDRKPLFDVLTCIHHHTTLHTTKDILIQNGERHLRELESLYELWDDRPDLLEETLHIAAGVEFKLDDIRYRYPAANLPPRKTSADYLRDLTFAGLDWRYPGGVPDPVRAQLEKELAIVRDLGYEDYFLTLHEICEFAKERKILYQGRGSAAGSVICFSLGLTAVDPAKIDLLFERFLSKERREPPDIDIDFEHERREEVIQHIYEKYDAQHAGMVCTVIRYRSRLAIRETAKVLGIPNDTVTRVVKHMGREGFARLAEPGLHAEFDLTPEDWALWLHLTAQLRGFPRHLGIHTGGFLITHDPITEMVPVEKATMNGRYVIQWNKDDVNTLGLMKIDLLSLGMLTALRKALHDLRTVKGIDLSLATIPSEDTPTYDMIGRADTVGVFQIESRAQMTMLPRLKPRNFYDLVIEVALVRPGPLQGGMVHPFLRRRQGLETVEYEYEPLRKVLDKTMGVPIFQEQVMSLVVVAAGFSPGEADELRRIMSAAWRKQGTMDGIRLRIMEGMRERGISRDYAERIYQTIEGFASYGFPESHAASFALLTYASCYLKWHHPDVFAVALLNSQPMGFYAPRVLIADAQRHGVIVRSLDVQRSSWDYTLEDRAGTAPDGSALFAVRTGFRSVYGLARKHIDQLVTERERGGPFESLMLFVQRTRLPKSVLLKLAASGALREFGGRPMEQSARELLWVLEGMCLSEESLFWTYQKDGTLEELEYSPPAESRWDEMSREYRSHGFSTELHPLSVLRPDLEKRSAWFARQGWLPFSSSRELEKIPSRRKIRLAGLVSVKQKPPTAKGMCFLTMEDEFGFFNIVIPPVVYEKHRRTIYERTLLEVRGVVEKHQGVTNIRALEIFALFAGPDDHSYEASLDVTPSKYFG